MISFVILILNWTPNVRSIMNGNISEFGTYNDSEINGIFSYTSVTVAIPETYTLIFEVTLSAPGINETFQNHLIKDNTTKNDIGILKILKEESGKFVTLNSKKYDINPKSDPTYLVFQILIYIVPFKIVFIQEGYLQKFSSRNSLWANISAFTSSEMENFNDLQKGEGQLIQIGRSFYSRVKVKMIDPGWEVYLVPLVRESDKRVLDSIFEVAKNSSNLNKTGLEEFEENYLNQTETKTAVPKVPTERKTFENLITRTVIKEVTSTSTANVNGGNQDNIRTVVPVNPIIPQPINPILPGPIVNENLVRSTTPPSGADDSGGDQGAVSASIPLKINKFIILQVVFFFNAYLKM